MRRITWLFLAVASVLTAQALAENPTPNDEEMRRAKVFATVGSETITVGELDDIVAARSPYARKRLLEEDALKRLAEAQVENELYYQGAEKLGYGNDPEVERFVDQVLLKVYVREEFQEAVSPDDLPDEQIAEYYKKHEDEFRRPEMRRARHILVGSQKEADEILKLLDSDETQTFRKLAKDRSLDTETNVRGGDLLFFTADGEVVGRQSGGTIDATLVQAAFALNKTGDLSKPLDLGDGKWSVLELTGIRPGRVQSLEEASGAIRRQLWREDREAALDAKIASLREEVKPETHPERLDAIVLAKPSTPIEPPNQ
jgi:peptidyl-prolyl cis-trans isomerase C